MTNDAARRSLPGELTRVMAARGIRAVDLARLMGVRPMTVSEWRNGIRFPLLAHAPALAEHLDSPRIAELVMEGHRMTCVVCSRTMYRRGKARGSRYCSPACKATDHSRRARGHNLRVATVAANRLREHQEAVLAHCLACTLGSSLCPDATCALRSVSPLPLAARRVA